MDWFLYDRDLRHERVNTFITEFNGGSKFVRRTLGDLNPFTAVFYFYTLWKCQRTFGFVTVSAGIETEQRGMD